MSTVTMHLDEWHAAQRRIATLEARLRKLDRLAPDVIAFFEAENAQLREALRRAELWLMNDHTDNIEEALEIIAAALAAPKNGGT